MSYMSVSFTHKNTDIFLREKLSFSNEVKKREILRLIGSNSEIKECFVLSTCNRVEIFAVTNDFEVASKFIIQAISKVSGVEFDELESRADIYEDYGAIHHLFSVASSLDSLVVGETQIVGQLKDAYKFALNNRSLGNETKQAVLEALKCAAEIRNKTDISKNPISVSSVAVAMAKDKIGSLNGVEAVVIGAGEMSELACKHLLTHGAKVTILNRNLQNAKNLAQSLGEGVKFDSLEKLKSYINKFSLIFSATGATGAIITDDLIESVDFKRYFFDIAVPRDIELSDSADIEVCAVDDLEDIVKKNLILREEQARKAYAIVGDGTTEFFKKLKSQACTPVVKALRQKARDISEIELNKAIKKGYLKNSDKEEAKKLIHQVFKAFLHTPSVNLKNLDDNSDMDTTTSAVLDIFGLNEIYDELIEKSKETEIDNEI